MSCIKKISADLLFDCANPPSQGIETNALIVNSEDIDRTASTVDTDGKINVVLKEETEGFLIQGIKQINSFNYELEVNDDSLNKVIHRYVGRIYNLTPTAKDQINAFIDGANVVVIVQNKAKGIDNLDAFEVLGYENGLEISEGTKNSQENDGAFTLTLASNPLSLEPRVPLTYLDTDYDTTLTAFENKLSTVTPL